MHLRLPGEMLTPSIPIVLSIPVIHLPYPIYTVILILPMIPIIVSICNLSNIPKMPNMPLYIYIYIHTRI